MPKKKEFRIVAFVGSWCRPCKAYLPLLRVFCSERDLPLEEVDVDGNDPRMADWGVMGVPFTVLTDGKGDPLGSLSGNQSMESVLNLLERL